MYEMDSKLQIVYEELQIMDRKAGLQMEEAIKNGYSVEQIAYLHGIIAGISQAAKVVRKLNKVKK